jgi:SOS response regulatory protein OraA/RecX
MRRARPGVILLEVDGEPWRTVPDDVVIRCGLAADVALERPLLRRLRAELRRAEALALAGRALRTRDLSRRRVGERLEQAGLPPAAGQSALAALVEAGVLDDSRLAVRRAHSLAERGWGNAAVAERLRGEGIGEDEIQPALADLEPELDRAARLVANAGGAAKAWALLSRRGFNPDTIEALVDPLDGAERGGLG